MNTEPPTGDDMQRMVVSIKEDVLRRTGAQRQKRRLGRNGIIVGAIAVVLVGTASSAVELGMIPAPFIGAAPSPTASVTPTPEPIASASVTAIPRPTGSAGATSPDGSIPTACRQAVPAEDYERLFGDTPLEQLRPVPWEATADPIPVPPAHPFFADASLYCSWRDPGADVSGLTVGMGTATAAELSAYQADVVAQGYTCTDRDGGRVCQHTAQAEPYPVDRTISFFARGTTWIEIDQTNTPTNNLLGALVEQVWG